MRLFWKILLPLLAIGAGAALLWLLYISKRVPVRKPIVITPPTVAVVAAHPEKRRIDINTQGRVQARATSALGAEVSGVVIWVRPDLATGVLVQAGDELLRIDDTDYQAAAAEAEAQLFLRRKELAEEQVESARSAREWKIIGTGEPSDLVLRKPQMAAVEARIKAAEAALKKAKRDIERTSVRAPYRARISRKTIDLGSRVAPGSELLNLQAADAYEVVMSITLDELRYLSLPLRGEVLDNGPSVTFTASVADAAVTWPGRIVRTEADLNAQTRMVQTIARIEQPTDDSVAAILTGMYVRATIAGIDVDNVVELPLNVLQADDVVYVYRPSNDQSGIVHQRTTTVIERTDTNVLVHGDIKEGDLVISGRVSGIRNGMQAKREKLSQTPTSAPTPNSTTPRVEAQP